MAACVLVDLGLKGAGDGLSWCSEIWNQVLVVLSHLTFLVAQQENWTLESFINMICEGVPCQYIVTHTDVLGDFIRALSLHPWLLGDKGKTMREHYNHKNTEKIS